MANSSLLPNGEQQFFDLNGDPLAGGLCYLYVPFTTTPKTSWVDEAQTTPNTNPISLDPLGRCVIWGNGIYRQLVTDAAGNLIFDQLTSDGGIADLQNQINTIDGEITTINTEITNLQNQIVDRLWLAQSKSPPSTSYQATPSDSGTLFISGSSGGPLTITLPNVSSIKTGWYIGLLRVTNNITAQVFGSASERILYPSNSALSVSTAPGNFENIILSFDGANYEVIEATPNTFVDLGSTNFAAFLGLQAHPFSDSGTFTIPAAAVKVTLVGGGGGGGGGGTVVAGAGGGSGAGAVSWLNGLTVGATLTVVVGTGGAAGTNAPTAGGNGNSTIVSSGSQGITTITAGGGGGGGAGLNAPGETFGGPGGLASGGSLDITGDPGEPTNTDRGGILGNLGLVGTIGIGGSGAGLNSVGNGGGKGIVIFEWVGPPP